MRSSKAVPWLRRSLTAEARVRSRFSPCGNCSGQSGTMTGFSLVLRFSSVNFIPPVLHYSEKLKRKLIIFITGLHNKPQGCGASVASAAGSLQKQLFCSVEQSLITITLLNNSVFHELTCVVSVSFRLPDINYDISGFRFATSRLLQPTDQWAATDTRSKAVVHLITTVL